MNKRKSWQSDDEDDDETFLIDDSQRKGNNGIDDLDADFDFFSPMNVILISLWSVGLVLFTISMVALVSERWDQLTSSVTSTAVRVQHASMLEFPAITVCNIQREIPLDGKFCRSYDNKTQCEFGADVSIPNCLEVNNDAKKLYSAKKTGLADTLMMSFSIHKSQYPRSAALSGVHISLHPPCDRSKDACPDVLQSPFMAAPGQVIFFRMTKVVNVFLNGTVTVHFEAQDSEIGQSNFESEFGDKDDVVVLGFHYVSMTEMVIKELPRYTLLTLSAEVGGIFGLFFGIGVINVLSGIIKTIFLGKPYVRSVFT